MTVQQRILEAQLVEKVKKNPRLAEQMGITIEYPKDLEKRIIKNEKFYWYMTNDQLLK